MGSIRRSRLGSTIRRLGTIIVGILRQRAGTITAIRRDGHQSASRSAFRHPQLSGSITVFGAVTTQVRDHTKRQALLHVNNIPLTKSSSRTERHLSRGAEAADKFTRVTSDRRVVITLTEEVTTEDRVRDAGSDGAGHATD